MRVLSQVALLATIEELAHRLRFPCIPTIKESDGGGEGGGGSLIRSLLAEVSHDASREAYSRRALVTWPPVLPGILFRYENRSGRQHWSSQSLPPQCLRR